MARLAKPWYRASLMMWYVTLDGVQVSLNISGDTPEAQARAVSAVAALVAARGCTNPQPVQSPHVRTVAEAVAEFLLKRKPRISPGCWRQYDVALRVHFLPAFGTRPLASLTPEEIEEWADRPDWSNSTRHGRIGTVLTFLKWAKNPLKISRPPMESRGSDSVLTDEQFTKVMTAARAEGYGSDLAALLSTLRESGARPQEIAALTVAAVDWDNRLARIREHKGRRHGGDRIVHFSTLAMETLHKQREKHGDGYLFRTRNGNPWKPSQLVKRMVQVSEKCGVHATAYGNRHAFATKALSAGISDTVVAALLGHKGTAMIHKHYSHLGDNARVLKDAVDRLGMTG